MCGERHARLAACHSLANGVCGEQRAMGNVHGQQRAQCMEYEASCVRCERRALNVLRASFAEIS